MGRFCVIIEGNPGDGAVNNSRGYHRGQHLLSRRARAFRARAVRAIKAALEDHGPVGGETFRVVVCAYWPRRRHLALGLAMGDVDAPVKAVLDALEAGGVFDDDTRVVEVTALKHHDKDRPRIEVLVMPS